MARAVARAVLRLDSAGISRELVGGRDKPVQRLVHTASRRTANSARARSLVDTGHLKRSNQELPVTTSGLRVSGGVENTANYSLYVHEGTRPHVIRPRNGKALAFEYRGQTVVVKHVKHPGTKAFPFLRNALQAEAGALGFRVQTQ